MMNNNALIAHVRDINGHIHTTVALVDGKVGIAVRNGSDQISKKQGRQKAIGRALSNAKEKTQISWQIDHGVEIKGSGQSTKRVHVNRLIIEAIDYLKGRAEKLNKNV